MKQQKQQQGFTLIELIVVIVILGILAAIAMPRFTDMARNARVAKMQGASGALQASAALFHGTWLIAGSPTVAAVALEGVAIPYINGYPDVGGDGPAADAATLETVSGIFLAAGLSTDYDVTTVPGTTSVLTILPDAGHPLCKITYTQPVAAGDSPAINATAVTLANC